MRKPSVFRVDGRVSAWVDECIDEYPIRTGLQQPPMTPAEARRLAAWLVKAAAWAEEMRKKK